MPNFGRLRRQASFEESSLNLLEGRTTRLKVVRFSELWGEAAWYLEDPAPGGEQPT